MTQEKPKKKTKNNIRVDSLPADILPLPYHSEPKSAQEADDGNQNTADIYDFLPDGIYDRYSD